LVGQISVQRNVSFRYTETERFVLENIDLKVQVESFATVMGPSGGGKTTLLKIMLGLLEPTSGEVLVDGIPLQPVGVRVYREQVAAVMQEDQLLSDSIADNIGFFDPNFRPRPAEKTVCLKVLCPKTLGNPLVVPCTGQNPWRLFRDGERREAQPSLACHRDERTGFSRT
jgi:ABC-type bacteriocin/lantibiotic exporter with double-glycine peptidase domain